MCSTLSEKEKMDREPGIPGAESSDRMSGISSPFTYAKSRNTNCRDCCDGDSEADTDADSRDEEEKDQLPARYLDENVFNLLIPALEETLAEASKCNALRVQKCRLNGLDNIAEILWNRNPRRSKIFTRRLNVFNIPPFKEYLRQYPRPYYPKSWLWTEDEAALHIQRFTRGWLVRKRADVQELRQFWKDITKRTSERKNMHIEQTQGVSRDAQEDKRYRVSDEDLHRCEKYRSMISAQKTSPKRAKSVP